MNEAKTYVFLLITFEEEYVQTNVINPEIKGTINVLKSCMKSRSVKRVVLTSTISTLTGKDADGKQKRFVDESCQTFVDQVWKNKPSGWVSDVYHLANLKLYSNSNSLWLL